MGRNVQPTLNDPQAEFLDLPHKFRAFVSGFGGGKTWAGTAALCQHALKYPGVPMGYFAPTYPMIRDIFFPTCEEVAEDWGLRAEIKSSVKEVNLHEGRRLRATVICRSMDNPGSIIGFKIGHAQVDEIDTMPLDKATHAWRKIIARLRHRNPKNPDHSATNGADITTTPEGFRFVYQMFVKEVRLRPALKTLYGIVHASTYDNEAHLPVGYIDSLRATYPPQLIDAYIGGKFVNLASGSVYPEFSRTLNHTDAELRVGTPDNPGEPLHIGMDFNVLNMTAVIAVIRAGNPYIVDELTGVRDTPTMARIIKERYREGGHHITIYPDASGGNTSSKNASESDLSIIRQNGLSVRCDPANPMVKDRVNAVCAMILNSKGERRLRVNTNKCPVLTDALEQQAYDKNGEPDKTTGHDHPCFVGSTRVLTPSGLVRFDQLPQNGEVLGPDGTFVPYVNARKTGRNKVTVVVRFSNGYRVECTPDHRFLTEGGLWVEAKNLEERMCVSSVARVKHSRVSTTTFAGSIFKTLPTRAKSVFTELYGSLMEELSLAVFMFTTLTATGRTTRLKISLAYPAVSINPITPALRRTAPGWRRLPRSMVRSPKSGTNPQPVESGTGSITRKLQQRFTQELMLFVRSVELFFKRISTKSIGEKGFARTTASPQRGETAASMTCQETARHAVSSLQPINTIRVFDVVPAGMADVYCLEVPSAGCFKLTSDSPIVSNCDATGYLIVQHWPVHRPLSLVRTLSA